VAARYLLGDPVRDGHRFRVLHAVREPATRSADVYSVVRWVVIADWLFTTPAVVVQPATGWYLAHRAGLPLETQWIVWSIGLYVLAGACWVPVVWMQIKMRDMARSAIGSSLPARYWSYFRIWIALGVVAFSSLVVVFYLMVAKPV